MIIKKPELLNQLRNYYVSKNIPINEANIFGIRFEENQNLDLWNDWLGIWNQNEAFVWSGTTDPGKKATEESTRGCAHVVLGYHPFVWQVGIHSAGKPSQHPALVQTGNEIKIWRDKNKDFIYNSNIDFFDTGYFGINFHRASKIQDVEFIGPYSAGCQVTRNAQDFEFALNLLLNTEAFKKDNKFRFSYMLFDKSELSI